VATRRYLQIKPPVLPGGVTMIVNQPKTLGALLAPREVAKM